MLLSIIYLQVLVLQVEYLASFDLELFRIFYWLLVRQGDAEGVRVQDCEDFVLLCVKRSGKALLVLDSARKHQHPA